VALDRRRAAVALDHTRLELEDRVVLVAAAAASDAEEAAAELLQWAVEAATNARVVAVVVANHQRPS